METIAGQRCILQIIQLIFVLTNDDILSVLKRLLITIITRSFLLWKYRLKWWNKKKRMLLYLSFNRLFKHWSTFLFGQRIQSCRGSD